MKKVEKKMQVFKVQAVCEFCEVELDHSKMLTTHPPLYEYICPSCNRLSTSETDFPSIEYR